jgi:tellurite resistance protein
LRKKLFRVIKGCKSPLLLATVGVCLLLSVYCKQKTTQERQDMLDIQLKEEEKQLETRIENYKKEKERKDKVFDGLVKQYSYINRNIKE